MSDFKLQFQNLSGGEKAAYIINNGRQITSRKDGKYIANLFSVDDFLVEVKYDRQSVSVHSIEIIEDSDIINHYIDSALSNKSTQDGKS